MEWRDEAVILGVRRHGEGSVIVEVMTPAHGRHMGLVRGGRSSRMRALLQPGNSVEVTWRARLDEHLGNFAIEADRLRAAMLMETPMALNGLQLLAAHMRLLPERDPHAALYHAALVILDNLDEPEKAARLVIRFELALLEELGFGLDLASCAATGDNRELVYVSPKTGRAVSRTAGAPWADEDAGAAGVSRPCCGGGYGRGWASRSTPGLRSPATSCAGMSGSRAAFARPMHGRGSSQPSRACWRPWKSRAIRIRFRQSDGEGNERKAGDLP